MTLFATTTLLATTMLSCRTGRQRLRNNPGMRIMHRINSHIHAAHQRRKISNIGWTAWAISNHLNYRPTTLALSGFLTVGVHWRFRSTKGRLPVLPVSALNKTRRNMSSCLPFFRFYWQPMRIPATCRALCLSLRGIARNGNLSSVTLSIPSLSVPVLIEKNDSSICCEKSISAQLKLTIIREPLLRQWSQRLSLIPCPIEIPLRKRFSS